MLGDLIKRIRKPFLFRHGDSMSEEDIIKSRRYRILLQIRYVDTGIGKLSYLRYAVMAIFVVNQELGAYVTAIFGAVGYFLGRWWYKSGMVIIEGEMGNQFNKFQKQMREKIVKGK